MAGALQLATVSFGDRLVVRSINRDGWAYCRNCHQQVGQPKEIGLKQNKRKPITKKTRFEVFKRDGFTCQYCGATPPSVILHVDHIDPVANGGSNDMDNLTTSCSHCNLGKGKNSLDSVPKSLAEKAEETKEAELQIREYNKILNEKRERLEDDAWDIVYVLQNGNPADIDRGIFLSIKKFLNQLTKDEVIDAAEIALAYGPRHSEYRRLRYFCGVCWNKIKEDRQ